MTSKQDEIPALESGSSLGFFGSLSSPIGMMRRTMSYDELMDAPIHSPPPDMTINMLWKDPLIPRHKFRDTAEDGETRRRSVTFEASFPVNPTATKTKATSLMPSLMMTQNQQTLEKFEHQAGLTDTGYSPRKGLSTEDTQFHRLGDGTLPKLKMPSEDFKEDRLTSAQSTPSCTPSVTPNVTPCVSPHASPAARRRSWFGLCSPLPLANPELDPRTSSTVMGGNEGGGDRWSLFGARSVVQRSPTDPGSETSTGFSLQSYLGLQKSPTIDGTNTQISLKLQDPSSFMTPKIDITGIDGKPAPPRPHKLRPRDMNVLTPSGF